MSLYRTIVADPPWHYEGVATSPGEGKQRHGDVVTVKAFPYPTMTVAEIAALPVRDLAEPSARLFLWTTNLYLPSSFGILEAWGFKYKQTLVWHKTGNPSPFGGSVAPNHAEYLLVATVGDPEPGQRIAGSVVAVPKPYAHSQKPEVFLDLVEIMSPGPYVELFARRNRIGWDTWGNEALGHVDMTDGGGGLSC